ncbi:MAG: hypothetical protein IPG25_16710 [Proteobacteria bacterium]|nr:hypothetical protein [Pseudomonadota bacterium]
MDSSKIPAPRNVGMRWTTEEERLMMAAFDAGHAPADIAATLQRSLAGVEARLEKLGRLAAAERTTRDRYRRTAPLSTAGA